MSSYESICEKSASTRLSWMSAQTTAIGAKTYLKMFWKNDKIQVYLLPSRSKGSDTQGFIDNCNYHRRHQVINQHVAIKLYIHLAA